MRVVLRESLESDPGRLMGGYSGSWTLTLMLPLPGQTGPRE
jgi:hypothetical protein